MMLFSEADPLGGWLQVILQGGALALLAYIIVVMAPQLIKDAREERQSRDDNFAKMLGTLNERFDVRSQIIVSSIKEQTGILSSELKAVTLAMQTVCKTSLQQGRP